MTVTEPVSSQTAEFTPESILADYRLAYRSRQASLIGRKEVLTGKAKFGIFGDGKEVPQLAMARAFRRGDFRSGYYRDQTFCFATGISTLEQFFAQLYAHADVEFDPFSAGRSMNGHFATRSLDGTGRWVNLLDQYNTSSDVSPTGSQMPRLVGLAYASRMYRDVPELRVENQFSRNGEEIAFGTIGNASCAEGMFWEAINAAGVLQAPMIVSIWDDGYGISVPNEFQITKGNLSEVLRGFQRNGEGQPGYDLYTVRGWDYPALCETYLHAAAVARSQHVPSIIHVIELTQPQGHSTSGSHERYKTKERLAWEEEFDCVSRMRQWLVEQGIATDSELSAAEEEDRGAVREAQRRAWDEYRRPINDEMKTLVSLLSDIEKTSPAAGAVQSLSKELERMQTPMRRDLMRTAATALIATREQDDDTRQALARWRRQFDERLANRYGADLYAEGDTSALTVDPVPAEFAGEPRTVNGFEVINACFGEALARMPELSIMGEDVGRLGDVNQGCAGLQDKHGLLRVADTGIRECTILGQAIGMAMRGLRPIAEIQYLDYVLYALQIMSDDLATLRWRTAGGQSAPVIVRTRGHRLEGIWHAGSPMAGILHLVRGMFVCVPRNMTQAAGMYNTLLRGQDPAIVVEVLNGYRGKEKLPSNVGDFTVPLGVPETLRDGSDLTVVTYGACCRIVLDAAELLAGVGISVEVIDVQTLLPFDVENRIVRSIEKTARVLFVDEDVPGGASAFMLQQVVEVQNGYEWLDSPPQTVSAKPHRPAYGSDGDYWSKPNRESVFAAAYALMHESNPEKFPELF